ncbi:MAG TPA: nitroreductase family protein [Microbacteriaceae bacterium]|nr:nitroreductase family protein [Microbacteriaceae bacterium]
MTRTATTAAPITSVLAERWSPRAFDERHELSEETLVGLLEAARWSPSANNSQPWRFIVGIRGQDAFHVIAEHLGGFNRSWAASASALIVNIVDSELGEGHQPVWHEYDLGQAVAHLTVQASAVGLHTHQMGGVDRDGLAAALGLAPRYRVLSVTAIGAIGDPEALPEPLRARELAPRSRKELSELILNRDESAFPTD